MTRRWFALIMTLCCASLLSAQTSTSPADFGKLPLSFELNQGQADPQVVFFSHGLTQPLFFTHDAAILKLEAPAGDKSARQRGDILKFSLAGGRVNKVVGEGE